MQELNENQKKVEEDLRLFSQEKGLKSLEDEELKLYVERQDYRKGIYTQTEGFKQLVNDLKSNLDLFGQLVNQGKQSESKQEWENRKTSIQSFLIDLKQDLIDREEFLLTEDQSVTAITEDSTDFEQDSFVQNLPKEVPG